MKLKNLIEIYNNIPEDIGSVKLKFTMSYNKKLIEPVFSTIEKLYTSKENVDDILNLEIPLDFLYINIEDIPDDIGILDKKQSDAIFTFVK